MPIEVTLSGILIETRLLQPKKALLPIEVTPLGIVVTEQPTSKRLLPVSMMALQFSRESYTALPSSTTIEVRFPLQLLKTLFPSEVTLLGMVIEVRLLQPSNALSPIEVTLLGIVMEVRLRQFLNAMNPIEVTPSGMVIEERLKVLLVKVKRFMK